MSNKSGRRDNNFMNNRFENCNPNSASQAQSQRIINQLEIENKALKEELGELKSVYIQLTRESTRERSDERRVTLLKSQLIQCERQLLLLNDALGTRIAVIAEAENALSHIADTCRSYLAEDSRIGELHMSKDDVNRMIHTAESARIKLFKNIENTSMQRLHKPIQYLDKFIKPQTDKPATILDICSGDLEHISLKQVAKLESKLVEVYKQLLSVNQCLQVQVFPQSFIQQNHSSTVTNNNNQSGSRIQKETGAFGIRSQSNSKDEASASNMEVISSTVSQTPQTSYVKLYGESCRACRLLNQVLPDLLELSVLVPAAPLPVFRKPVMKELSVDSVMARLPVLSRAKTTEARQTVQAMITVLSLCQLRAQSQEKVYREDLSYHKAVYQAQLNYVDQLFTAIKFGYQRFEEKANTLICKPLKELLSVYSLLERTGSEDALKKLLRILREKHNDMSHVIEKLKVKGQADSAVSEFAEEFYTKLQELEETCQRHREDDINTLQEVKSAQEEYWAEIKASFSLDVNAGGDLDSRNSSKQEITDEKRKSSFARAQSLDSGRSSHGEKSTGRDKMQFSYERDPLPVIGFSTPGNSARTDTNEHSTLSNTSAASNNSYSYSGNNSRKPLSNSQSKFNNCDDNKIHKLPPKDRNSTGNSFSSDQQRKYHSTDKMSKSNGHQYKNIKDSENDYRNKETMVIHTDKIDPQKESEDLFLATLRSDFSKDGFVFGSIEYGDSVSNSANNQQTNVSYNNSSNNNCDSIFNSNNNIDDSQCTCGAEHSSIQNDQLLVNPDSIHSSEHLKTHSQSSDINRNTDSPLSDSKPPIHNPKNKKRLMKGVPQSKLMLKSRGNINSKTDYVEEHAAGISDSDQESTSRQRRRRLQRTGSVGDNRDRSPATGAQKVLYRAGSAGGLSRDDSGSESPIRGSREAICPPSSPSTRRRSGSLTRKKPEWR